MGGGQGGGQLRSALRLRPDPTDVNSLLPAKFNLLNTRKRKQGAPAMVENLDKIEMKNIEASMGGTLRSQSGAVDL